MATGAYHIAIIGSGPAGLSAAARAAQRDVERGGEPTHVLLESFNLHAKTIQRYSKGKFVMAEPGFLNLRSDCAFEAGSRENILNRWHENLTENNVNVRYNSEVKAITGQRGDFSISLADGSEVKAEYVILAIGLEGNPRRLNIPGEDATVQYQVDDPDEYMGENIVVVGAGDSAIENALALAKNNHVTILNRREEFSRAKEGNLNAVLKAINDPKATLDCLYETSPVSLQQTGDGSVLTVETPSGREELPVNRVVARLGAMPPRKFVESIGIQFSSSAPDAAPSLSAKYESSVPGVYVVGSLAGYPLIKQAMNQGYDVVEYIHGHDIKPADHELLQKDFASLPYRRDPDDLLRLFQGRIPMFSQINALVFRQVIIESNIWVAGSGIDTSQPFCINVGDYVYRQGEYTNTFFLILDGEVALTRPEQPDKEVILERGEFFGEDSLLSGRPRVGSAKANAECVLVEIPRRTMLKLMNGNEEVRRGIDWIFTVRALQKHFAPNLTHTELREIAETAELCIYKAGEKIFKQGDEGECLHMIRRGAVTLEREVKGVSSVVAQLQSDRLLGEMALMGERLRRETAIASVLTETIKLGREGFLKLIALDYGAVETLQEDASTQAQSYTQMQAQVEEGSVIGFLMDQGLGEATNAMVIDESLCVGCDNCEKACAETHGGISRLKRAQGDSHSEVHVPIACRHCEHPYCMKDCPPDAIHRAPSGEVFIDDSCIGCGNCMTHCPYDAIEMAYDAPKKPSLISWLLFGRGSGPGQEEYSPTQSAKDKGIKAVKCDACMDRPTGPACVTACPTGAAVRLGPDQFVELVGK